jgi:hypothetical protein
MQYAMKCDLLKLPKIQVSTKWDLPKQDYCWGGKNNVKGEKCKSSLQHLGFLQ